MTRATRPGTWALGLFLAAGAGCRAGTLPTPPVVVPGSGDPGFGVAAPAADFEGRPPRASWIWMQGDAKPQNFYAYFRKSVTLAAAPVRVVGYVAASPVGDLWVNGRLVDRIPMNADPTFQTYDRFDLTSFFQEGPNVVAALVHVYGMGMHHRMDVRGGLFFQLDVDMKDGTRVALDSDAGVLARRAEAWDAGTALRHPEAHLIGFRESFDGRKDVLGWANLGFTPDATWLPAVAIGVPPVTPWTGIVVVRRPFLQRERIKPLSKVVRGDVVVADMGGEVVGHPEFQVQGEGGETIEVGTAERLRPDGTPDTTATLDYRDSYITRKGDQTWQPFTWRGFRYIAIRAPASVVLRDIVVTTRSWAAEDLGDFASSDPDLDNLWRVGRRTLRLCMQDTLMDTPWREQTQYIGGDARFAQRFSAYAFGPEVEPLFQYNLMSGWFSQRWDAGGAIRGRYPTDFLLGPKTSTYIPDYQLEWVLMLREYHLHNNRPDFVARLWPALKALLQGFSARVSPTTGLLGESPGWTVLDHPDTYPMDVGGESAAMNALYVGALDAAATLAEELRGPEGLLEAKAFRAQAEGIRRAVNDRLWGEDAGAYRDGSGSGNVTPQTQAYLLRYGLVPENRRARALGVLLKADHKGEQSFSYWVAGTLFDEGRDAEALAYMRSRWGQQLKHRDWNGSWHESWDSPGGSTSHAWSGGPTALLPEKIVGLEPTAAGWSRFRVRPRVLDLTWAKARVATRRGPVAAAWRLVPGGLKLDVRVPPGAQADVVPPVGFGTAPVSWGPGDHTAVFKRE